MNEKVDDALKITDISDVSNISVSATVLGQLIGVKERRIRQLAEEKVLVRVSKGKYNLIKSIRNYILNIKLAFESEGKNDVDAELDLDEERALHERVKRRISELKLSVMKNELHRADDVSLVMSDMLSSVRSKLLSLPSKLAPILVSRNDAAFIKSQINNEVLEILNELKDYSPDVFCSKDFVSVEGCDVDEGLS